MTEPEHDRDDSEQESLPDLDKSPCEDRDPDAGEVTDTDEVE